MSSFITRAMMVAMVTLCFVGTSQATLLDYEGYNYTPGPLTGNGGWDVGTGTQTVDAGSLSYPGLLASGGHENTNPDEFSNRPFSIDTMFTTPDTYYATYLFNMDSQASGLAGLGQLALRGGAGGFVTGKSQGDGSGGGTFVMQVTNVNSASIPISAGVTHMVAYRIINDGNTATPDQVDMVLDPLLTASGEPDWNSPDLTMNTVNLTIAAPASTLRVDRNYLFDEARVATTWAEAAPFDPNTAIPEPGSFVMLCLGGLMMLLRRQR